jgi:MYXO-CTERM domain-containing protein
LRTFALIVACGALAVAGLSCVQSDEPAVGARPIVSPAPGPGGLAAGANAPAYPPDRFLVYTGGGQRFLPKWKTERERQIERLARQARAAGLPYADQYDDYRNQNIDKFFTTQPPVTAGIRPPAEYEPSQAYLLFWPSYYSQPAWKAYFGGIIKGAWGVVPLLLIYDDAAHKTWLEQELTALGYSASAMQDPQNVIWWEHQTNSIWARDYGPVSIVSGTGVLSFVDFRYYHGRPRDDETPAELAKAWGVNDFRPDLEFEGGNFMSTSDGLCAATKGVLAYNPQLSQSAVEQLFVDYLGCQQTLLAATMTGGVIPHIDMFSKLASDTQVLVGEYTASQDAANKAILDGNAALFAAATTPTGKAIQVTRIPMPTAGTWLFIFKIWRTYTNSLSLSGPGGKVVLIPTYSGETSNESAAMAAYASVYPGWTLVKVDSEIIIPNQGAIHCTTMQIPQGQKAKMEADPPDLCGPTQIACGATTDAGVDAAHDAGVDATADQAVDQQITQPDQLVTELDQQVTQVDHPFTSQDGSVAADGVVAGDDGCSCAVGAAPSPRPSPWSLLLLGVGLLLARRRGPVNPPRTQ